MLYPEVMDLTEEIILQHGQNSPHRGRLKDANYSADAENSMCGDSLKIELKIEKGKVLEAVFEGEGCLISQAAASLLIGKVKEIKDIEKIKKFNDKIIFKLLEIELTLSRVKCAQLSIQTLQKALRLLPEYSQLYL